MQMGLVWLSLGLVLAVTGLSLYFAARSKARASDSWPSAPGQVTESYVERTIGHAVSTMQRRPVYYVPVVRYVYSVNGRELRGDRVRLGNLMFFKKIDAQAVVDRYPPGAVKMVRYDPASPEQAVLEGGGTVHGRYTVLCVLGASLILMGALLASL
jgi:hypothetical protein